MDHLAPAGTPSVQTGFTLFEVLITMVVIAVGLLGSAGLVLAGIKTSQGAMFRTLAVNLAYDMADRMEANKNAAVLGNYAIAEGASVQAARDCASAACSEGELASYDLAQWREGIVALLPGGTGQISLASAPGANPATYTIVVGWNDRRSRTRYATTGTTESFSYTATRTVRR